MILRLPSPAKASREITFEKLLPYSCSDFYHYNPLRQRYRNFYYNTAVQILLSTAAKKELTLMVLVPNADEPVVLCGGGKEEAVG